MNFSLITHRTSIRCTVTQVRIWNDIGYVSKYDPFLHCEWNDQEHLVFQHMQV